MTLYECMDTLEMRKQGLAEEYWRIGAVSQLMENYPKKPQEAFPDLYPAPKSYAMPDFLKEKYNKRKGAKM